MDTLRSFFKPVEAPVEPPACESAFCDEIGGFHYSWRGQGREKAMTIGVYSVETKQWTLTPTTGPPPPGLWAGECAIIKNHLFCFGGYDGSSWFNDLYKLNLETLQWSKVHSQNNSSEQPISKVGCGLTAINERALVCFGGYGSHQTHVQSGATFMRGIGSGGWINEFHLFDIQEGVWFSPQVKGERPPPCCNFTFTKVDQDRAVLFGGYQSGRVKVSDLYIFNLRSMEVTKVEPAQGDQWPKEREGHAACCLNYGEHNPVILVSGGLGKGSEVVGDMWILDVDSSTWTEMTPPVSVRGRCRHSITATSLGPGLTEVLMFGGQTRFPGAPIAETTILRFERLASVTWPSTEKWAVVDMAHNDTRGSSQRLREKRKKIKKVIHPPSSERDEVRTSEQQLKAAEQKTQDNDRIEQATRQTEKLHTMSKNGSREALQTSQEAIKRLEPKQLVVETKGGVEALISEISRLREDLQKIERRAQLAEQQLEDTVHQKRDIEQELEGKTKELAAHNTEVWRIPGRDVSTVREIGTGGWGTVFEGQVKVAVKKLHDEINSPHNVERVHREMRLLAEVRHPNLVLFIGAVFDRSPPLIVTELLDMNLRQAYQQNQLGPGDRLSIFVDVAKALDYLHQRYEPIIHRDVSAPNVLLERMPNNQWKGKVSDLGSANFLQNAQTMGEGAIVYSPPEVIPQNFDETEPPPQTVKIDVYSYGIMLCEVTASKFPSQENYREMFRQVQRDHPHVYKLIMHCKSRQPSDRPSMAEVIMELRKMNSF